MFLESSRLKLRKMTLEDTERYHSWRNDLEVMRYTSPSLDTYTLEETRDFVESVILGTSASKSYIIVEKESDTPIGVTSLINIDYKNRNAECIIDLGEKRSWGKGCGKEAMGLLMEYAFLEMNLHRLSLKVYSFNTKAINLYNILGFYQEGVSRQTLYRDGEWHDVIHMGILQNEYRADDTTQLSAALGEKK
ncbi:GNAT family N-acetyltransferase [Alteribacter keqinensis]|uniref:N-acetyltransferase n=1 Tax=Alteribacter keqinensis TaxID=2483800 RepID=A0A3M7TPN2_9BACI|nr:GNAT family protein [Alteribacter keqinensis]RNA66977.1 N-acetyltransferase [Alteribacter keqinensis]